MEALKTAMSEIVATIGDRELDTGLQTLLNDRFPADGDVVTSVHKLCEDGERGGWLMTHEVGGIKFGRAIKPGTDAGRFSVDVVRMKDIKGPHHVHTTGEIGLVMAIDGTPRFDGFNGPWYVYEAGSDHWPTITGGDAYVLYLLPDGAIEFTGK